MVLTGLRLADEPATWEELGFDVSEGAVRVGGVELQLAGRAAGRGILGWAVGGLRSDVLPSIGAVAPASPGPPGPRHANGVSAVDHVVAFTGDLDASMRALAADGLKARRVREVHGGKLRQAFYVLDTALLELAGPVEGETDPRFWGLTLVADDLEALADRLGGRLGAIRPAVQSGRQIATLRRDAGSSVPLAFITPG